MSAIFQIHDAYFINGHKSGLVSLSMTRSWILPYDLMIYYSASHKSMYLLLEHLNLSTNNFQESKH